MVIYFKKYGQHTKFVEPDSIAEIKSKGTVRKITTFRKYSWSIANTLDEQCAKIQFEVI